MELVPTNLQVITDPLNLNCYALSLYSWLKLILSYNYWSKPTCAIFYFSIGLRRPRSSQSMAPSFSRSESRTGCGLEGTALRSSSATTKESKESSTSSFRSDKKEHSLCLHSHSFHHIPSVVQMPELRVEDYTEQSVLRWSNDFYSEIGTPFIGGTK